jgi:lipopolysaccharide transport system ATP-binding protein
MNDIAKRYRLGQAAKLNSNIREDLMEWASGIFRPSDRDSKGFFWALDGISLEVNKGDTIGIIGRNGAGKSTLLKILSRITQPTRGYLRYKGRLASLLEVGTGFHRELDGRENIYLNGAILGMRRHEIDQQFDAIVDFAGVEKFLDTPVKRYSSGMYVRLAFAVAAHLRTDILVVDEVLAVGDAEFQSKCLGKMQDVAHDGRTVFFVSHNMGAVAALTTKSLLLHGGRMLQFGRTDEVISAYISNRSKGRDFEFDQSPRHNETLGQDIRVTRIVPMPEKGDEFLIGEPLRFEVSLRSKIARRELRFGLTVIDAAESPVFSGITVAHIEVEPADELRFEVIVSEPTLVPGPYTIHLSVGSGQATTGRKEFDVVKPGPMFTIGEVSESGTGLVNWSRQFGSVIMKSEASRVRRIS